MRKRMKIKRVVGVTGLATLAARRRARRRLPARRRGGHEAADATTKVTVKASEFKYVFSKKSVPTGTVVFTVINKGKISHDFKIGGKKTKTLAARQDGEADREVHEEGSVRVPLHALRTREGGDEGEVRGRHQARRDDDDRRRRRPTTTTTPPPDGSRRQREHDRPGGHVRVRLQPLAAVGPVGPGHVRDQEQRQRGAQLHRPGREGRHLAQSRARRRPTRSACRRSASATSATCRSTSIAACWGP